MVAVLLSLPAVAAAPAQGFLDVEAPVSLKGGVALDAVDGHALARVNEGHQPFTFQVDAAAATLVEHYANFTRVDNVRGEKPLVEGENANGTRATTLIAPSIRATQVNTGATALIYPYGGEGHEVALRGGATELHVAERDHLTGTPRPDDRMNNGDSPRHYELDYVIDMAHVRAVGQKTPVTVTGDFALHLWEVTAHVASDAGERTVVTGIREQVRAGVATQSYVANATLLLRNATLTLVPGEDPIQVYAERLDGRVDGTLRATGAVGVLRSDDETAYVARNQPIHATGDVALAAGPSDEGETRMVLHLDGTFDTLDLPVKSADRSFVEGVAGSSVGWAAGTGLVLVVGCATVLALHRREMLAGRRPGRRRSRGADAAAAVTAMELGNYATALGRLDAALALDPENSDLLVDRGYCLERLGDVQAARLAYEKAVLADPGRAEAHYYYARALCALGLTTTALSHVSRAFALDGRLREQAGDDPAFRVLRDHPQFVSQLRARDA